MSMFSISRPGLLAAVMTLSAAAAQAQMTPVGNWHTIDDKTGEIKSLVVITETDGVLTGRIDKLLRKGADQARLCTECSDDRKDKPVLGMTIMRGVKQNADDPAVYDAGHILDPNNGKTYRVRI